MNERETIALLKAIKYWIANWDFECPTLFGLEKAQLEEVVDGWPKSLLQNERLALLVCLGSLRELLFGASAISEHAVQSVIGLSYEEASNLCTLVRQRLQDKE